MERILICSDIHRCKENFRQALLEAAPVDRILIAGELEGSKAEYEKIAGWIPMVAVAGNCDSYLGTDLPLTASFTVEGRHFFMTHGHHYGVGYGRPSLLLSEAKKQGADIVIFGHTHQRLNETWDGILCLNPGALRGNPSYAACSYILMKLDGAARTQEVSFYQLGQKRQEEETREIIDIPIVAAVMKDIRKGKSVSEIAKRNSIRFTTAEKICRLVLTHPMAEADSILSKMEL